MNDVLVLNRSWFAVHVADWQRAMSLLYTGQAKAVDVDDFIARDFNDWKELSQVKQGNFIHTETFKILIPEVIALNFYDELPPGEVKLTRKNIFERDKNNCGYCGKHFNREELNIDHVVPKSKGGKTEWTNLICSCTSCNNKKSARTPEEAGMKLQWAPAKPGWKGKIEIITGANRRISWKKFIEYAYWNVELER